MDAPLLPVPPPVSEETISRRDAASQTLVGKSPLQRSRQPSLGFGFPRTQFVLPQRIEMTVDYDHRHTRKAPGCGGLCVASMHMTVQNVIRTVLAKKAPQIVRHSKRLICTLANEDASAKRFEAGTHARINGACHGQIHAQAAG
jgi:hypothetical protein